MLARVRDNMVHRKSLMASLVLAIGFSAPLAAQQADPSAVDQVLFNLVDNAVKYTDRGGTITISASPSGGSLVLEVSDTGPGIPEELLGHVFERFSRVDESHSAEGTGLGLSIVKQVVEDHGGTVIVDAAPGGYRKRRLARLRARALRSSPPVPALLEA